MAWPFRGSGLYHALMTSIQEMAEAIHRALVAAGMTVGAAINDTDGTFLTVHTSSGQQFQLDLFEVTTPEGGRVSAFHSKSPQEWGPWGSEGRPPSPDQLND